MLARMLGLKNGDEGRFVDQEAIPAWAREPVAAAASEGIVRGYEDNTFRPGAFITRAEIALMVANAARLPLNDGAVTWFADDGAIPSWARPFVSAAAEAGLIVGRENRRFEPLAFATRAESVALLLRLDESWSP